MKSVDARRAMLVAAGFLLALAFVSALTPRQEAERAVKPPAGAAVPVPPAESEGVLPRDGTVNARVGEVVRIEVRADVTDDAEIEDLGIRAPVEPDLPAQLEFVADRAGEFPVTLRAEGDKLGVVRVSPAR